MTIDQLAPARTSPSSATLVYDGDCGFCTRWVAWIRPRLPDTARIASSTGTDIAALGLTAADVAAAAWWIDPDGRRRRGHAAIGTALVEVGGWWRIVGVLLLTPPVSWCAACGYALVARFRAHLPGGSPSCRVPQR